VSCNALFYPVYEVSGDVAIYKTYSTDSA